MTDYKELPYDQLKGLHREIGALLTERRKDELDQLRIKMAELGFTPDDLTPKRNGKGHAQKYRNPANGETWSGRGHRPQWVKDALDEGRQLEEFLIAS